MRSITISTESMLTQPIRATALLPSPPQKESVLKNSPRLQNKFTNLASQSLTAPRSGKGADFNKMKEEIECPIPMTRLKRLLSSKMIC